MKILYVTPNHWGKGKDIEEAKANCKKAGARDFKVYVAYEASDDAWVDDMGCLRWKEGPHPKKIKGTRGY